MRDFYGRLSTGVKFPRPTLDLTTGHRERPLYAIQAGRLTLVPGLRGLSAILLCSESLRLLRITSEGFKDQC